MFDSLLSIAGPLIGGLMQGDAAESAAEAQQQATDSAIGEQRRQYDQNREDLAPYRNAGGSAVNRLSELLGLGSSNAPAGADSRRYASEPRYKAAFDELNKWHQDTYGIAIPDNADLSVVERQVGELLPKFGNLPETADASQQPEGFGSLNKKFTLADFWDDPVTKASYEFGLNEGTKALDRMAGARGSRNSGAQLKALTKFGTDYTGTKANESYGRFYGDQDRTFNRLAGVSGVGQTATNTGVSAGSNTSNNIAGMITAQGNARGAAQIAGGNAISGGLNTVGNWFQQQQQLDKILNKGGISGQGSNPYYTGTGMQGDYQYG